MSQENHHVRVAVVYHSGFGHTEVQAKAVAEGIDRAGGRSEPVPVEQIEQHWETLAAADAIIFGSPTYMGSVSAQFKTFMDASSKVWFGQGWKDKLAAGFTNSASMSGDKLNTLQQLSVFAAQHGMIWVGLGLMPGANSSEADPDSVNRIGSYLGAMAQSNADQGADAAPPESDRETARLLGERVARAAARWRQQAA